MQGKVRAMQWTDAGIVGASVGAWAVLSKVWDVRVAALRRNAVDNTTLEVRLIDEGADIRREQRERIELLEQRVEESRRDIKGFAESLSEERAINKSLQAHIANLTADNRVLIDDNSALKQDNAALREANIELRARNAEWKQQIAFLNEQVLELQNRAG
jgi:chromosome segregation ATPase